MCNMHYGKARRLGLIAPLQADVPICSVEGCSFPVLAGGYCVKHYQKLRKHGSPIGGLFTQGERASFYQTVVLKYERDDACLIWPFYRDEKGYAKWGKGKTRGGPIRVHRQLCIDAHGPPPFPDAEAAHNCGRGHLGCVTKKHLRWDTASGNQKDRTHHGTDLRGEKQWNHKLTADEVREIRRLAPEISKAELARRFNVSHGLIRGIINRRNWAWLK
jgi:hypothetical protein